MVRALSDAGIAGQTLSIFTSDNGPWYQGSPGRLRGRKGMAYEGGVREPFLAHMPGTIPAGLSPSGFGSLMDLFPTFASLANAPLPAGPLDGINIWPMLSGQVDALSRDALLYFDSWNIQCARLGPWKLHIARYNSFPWVAQPGVGRVNLPLLNPELYNIEADPEESYECSAAHPDVVAQIRARVSDMLPSFPARVQAEYAATQARLTNPVNPGELPNPQ